MFISFFEGIQAFHDACNSLLDFRKHLAPALFAIFLFMYVMMSPMILMLTVYLGVAELRQSVKAAPGFLKSMKGMFKGITDWYLHRGIAL